MGSNSSDFFKILDDLNSSSFNPVSSGLSSSDVTSIQTLKNNINSYSQNNNIQSILSAQSDMSGILQQEKDYLKKRKQDIAHDVETGERVMKLNDSNRKKYYYYVLIVLGWVGVLVLILALFFLNRSFGIPFNFLFILIMVTALSGSGFILYQMSFRDPTDFDKMNLLSPQLDASLNNIKTTNGSIFGSFGIDCVGSNCCPPGNPYGLVYDESIHKCVLPGQVSSTTVPNNGSSTGSSSTTNRSTTVPNPTAFTNMTEGFNTENLDTLSTGKDDKKKEGFMGVDDLLAYYPPQFPMRIGGKPVQYNYACESEKLYCAPKIDSF